MSRLSIRLLGPFEVTLDGEPVTGFAADKVRALLAYLSMPPDQTHRRETLAGLFWPEYPERSARASLRNALGILRRVIGDHEASPPYVLASRQTIRFNRESDHWLDAGEFAGLLAAREPGRAALKRAVSLYRGPFLQGFSMPDSAAFEEWLLFTREHLGRQVGEALADLVRKLEAEGAHEEAVPYARRRVELDPWREGAHRQLMSVLAQSGQRSAALAQYEACCRALADKLGVEPAPETRRLYERIRDGDLERETVVPVQVGEPEAAVELPRFLVEEADRFLPPAFVAREREMAQLDAHLAAALDGHGGVVFVTGEAGCGKTALLAEFARRAQEARGEVIVAGGACNAFSGVGDPYLPFREVMGMLTGDVEARWAAGLISREHARRLWQMLPEVVQALVDRAPDLIDVFVAGKELESRSTVAAPGGAGWLDELRVLRARRQAGAADLSQSQLMGQYATLLHSLAAGRLLLITLDDLQWADVASIGLLFHLARHLAGSRVLLAGAYRPEEVALGRDGAGSEDQGRHPLQKVLSELKRTYGDIWIDLSAVGESEGRAFVDALLDSEPNRLGEGFRQALFRQTDGHPLFTVELLRGMQERGNLVRDAEQHWVKGSTLDWRTLPVRVEGVIEERMGRLERGLREILSVASVEGERFTAEVVARVRGLDEGQVLRDLARLERRHRLVQEREGVRVDGQLQSRYQFSHILFQRYLYGALSAAERRLLHAEIAQILEGLYAGRTGEIAVQLAGHYGQAEERAKAAEYLHQAGDRARGLYAFPQAVDYYERALALLQALKEHGRAARTLMKLGLTYHLAHDFRGAREAYEEGFALWQRAGELHVEAPSQPASHALRVGLGLPTNLDPAVDLDIFSGSVMEQLFSGLAQRTSEMDVVPDVAQSWEVTEGGRKYVFRLREDARWSDGSPVTARDFEYAWRRALDPAVRSTAVFLMDNIKGATAFQQAYGSGPEGVGVRALDDFTLVVELEGPIGHLPHLLTIPGSFPVPSHVVERLGSAWTEPENLVTNGPFRLEAWQPGRSAILVRNPAYHGRFNGNVQRLEISLLADPSERLALYEADGLDILLCDLPAADLDRARHRHAGGYVSVPTLGTDYVGFDTSRPPFDDPRVRRAFVLATDRDTLVDKVLRGTVFAATGGFVPPGMLGHSAGMALPYDPDEARWLLAEAGYPDGRGFPAVEFLTDQKRRPASEYLEAHWRAKLGVEITDEVIGWEEFLDRLVREPPHIFCLGETSGTPDPDEFLRLARPGFLWENETYDQLVEEARRAVDQGRRIELYQEADRILIEEAAIMPVAYGRHHLLVKPWVRRWPLSPTKFWFWKDVIVDPH